MAALLIKPSINVPPTVKLPLTVNLLAAPGI
jgi:hypothetical protein